MIKTLLITTVFFTAFWMVGVPVTGGMFVLFWCGLYVVTKLAKNKPDR